MSADRAWMAGAIALSWRGRGRTAPNPNVGCILLDRQGRVAGRGWTQPGGRPHAEAIAIAQAGDAARGGTAYVTLEPCAHESARGPACTDLLIEAGIARVVIGTTDPDPRTNGKGMDRLRAAGIIVTSGELTQDARRAMAGFFMRQAEGRPHVTLKLATSLDGQIALADGTSRWITGNAARTHAHLERAQHECILVGRGTLEADQPRLDVRLPGLEDRAPHRAVISRSRGSAPPGWSLIHAPQDIASLKGDHLLIEGGAETAATFVAADLVDRLLLYRAPLLIGTGKSALGNIGLTDLGKAHGHWQLMETHRLEPDMLEVYERRRAA